MNMSETTEKAAAAAKSLRDDLTRMGKDVWLASLGAVATLEEQGRTMFETLVAKGETFPLPERSRFERAVGQTREQVVAFGKMMEARMQDTSRAVLHRMGMPSHDEVQALIARIDQLNAKVEALQKKEALDD